MSKPSERELLRISEAAELIGLAEGDNQTQPGAVLVHLIRPCVGKGKGRHVYEAKMLQEHAESGHFDDWPMFIDHESPEARRKQGGLPRSIRDLGGRVVRTWWDPTIEADSERGLGQGAVVAEALPVPFMRDLIAHDPKLANVSINTFATGVKPVQRGGKTAYLVEGFAPTGSADWVTKAGAGGRVVELLEAFDTGEGSESEDYSLLESIPDEAVLEWLREQRPAVVESLTTKSQPATGDDNQEVDEMDKAEVAEAAIEAITSDEGKAALAEAVVETVEGVVKDTLKTVLPTAMSAVATTIEEQARAAVGAETRRGRLVEGARTRIEAAKLPELFEADLKSRFAEINPEDKTDPESGEVTESAEQQVETLVDAAITAAKAQISSINPTAVSENGGGSGEDTGDGKEVREGEHHEYRQQLQEAGVDMEAAYGVKPKSKAEPDEGKAEPEPAAAAA